GTPATGPRWTAGRSRRGGGAVPVPDAAGRVARAGIAGRSGGGGSPPAHQGARPQGAPRGEGPHELAGPGCRVRGGGRLVRGRGDRRSGAAVRRALPFGLPSAPAGRGLPRSPERVGAGGAEDGLAGDP